MHPTPTIPSVTFASGSDIRDLFHLFQKAPIGMIVFKGPSLTIEFLNEKTLEVISKKKEDVLGKPLLECFPELEKFGVDKILLHVFNKGEKFTAKEFEANFYKEGKLYAGYFDFSAEAVLNSQEQTSGVMVVFTEVTDQLAARKKIQESEALLRRTKEQLELSINAGRVGIWHWDVRKNVLTWSKEQFEIFGVNQEEFKGQAEDFFSYILEEDRSRINAASRLEFERSDNQYEYRIRRKDGSIRWIHSRSKTFLNKDGNAEYITGINIDITEQKNFSEKLEKEVSERTKELVEVNRRLMEAQQIANLGSWEYDVATGEVTWSDELYRIYGYEEKRFTVTLEKAMERMLPDDLVKTKERMKMHTDDAAKNFEETGALNYDIPPAEYCILLPNGAKKILRSVGKIILAEDGTINKMIGTIQDISEQKKAEEEILLMNAQLNEAQEIAHLGSWEWNLLSNKLTWSDNLYNVYGVDRNEEITYEIFASLVHPDDRTYVEKIIEAALHTNQLHDFYHRIITPAGEIKILHARGEVLLDHEGRVIGMRGTGQDVTKEKQVEDNLLDTNKKLAERMEELRKALEADKLKSDFIKMASHELKTPITSIKGYVQLLLAMVKEKENEKSLSPLFVKSSLTNIEKQVNRLTRLMGELLDLSKIESGQLELNKEEFSLNELVIDVVQDVLYTNPKHHINIYHDFTSTISADKDRIGQVLVNLLMNAIKYSPEADKIDVTISQHKNSFVAISIKDFGIGIDKKDHERIFERFYRAEGPAEQTYPGFGIGLFIAKEMVTRHNGEIKVESSKGKGSVFTFTLPL